MSQRFSVLFSELDIDFFSCSKETFKFMHVNFWLSNESFWLYMFIISLLDEVNASNSALYIRCLRCKELLV